ncbi:hypothetical protein NDU88_003543 [Pleurodeles waltl]|uniref:Uncharacterized protein n=1 Tax=Pleurodeles waltl TaxID=8319 RepID=A0AAV7MQV7_PLEWA|nr:hypothetical protein NDU88_003543 [Pleurodeles waltl]
MPRGRPRISGRHDVKRHSFVFLAVWWSGSGLRSFSSAVLFLAPRDLEHTCTLVRLKTAVLTEACSNQSRAFARWQLKYPGTVRVVAPGAELEQKMETNYEGRVQLAILLAVFQGEDMSSA